MCECEVCRAPSQCLVSSTVLGEHVSLGPGGAVPDKPLFRLRGQADPGWALDVTSEAALIHTPALVPSGCGQAAPLEAQFQFPYDVVTVPVSVPGARHPGAC